jgi:hypothetical protein
MQCKCGSHTVDHDVVEEGTVVAKFARCVVCGMVRWWFDKRKSDASIGSQGYNTCS